MKLFSKKNKIILYSIFLLLLIVELIIFPENDPFKTFMSIAMIAVMTLLLSLVIYDGRKTKS